MNLEFLAQNYFYVALITITQSVKFKFIWKNILLGTQFFWKKKVKLKEKYKIIRSYLKSKRASLKFF